MAEHIERLHRRRFDGYRGRGKFPGWWISLGEAREICGEAWWTLPPCLKVEPIQYDRTGRNDRPIWLWENGDMYLGRWKRVGKSLLYAGLAIRCSRDGMVTVANWDEGNMQGPGEFFWLDSSDVWKENWLYYSPIKTGKALSDNNWGRPFCFKGIFQDSMIHDDHAVVRIKKGTIRVGPWKNGIPVGDWHNHTLAPKDHLKTNDAAVYRPILEEEEHTPKPDWRLCGHNKGLWISLNDPRASGGDSLAWWDLPPCRAVDLLRNITDAPVDKPMFLYHNGNMYLGNWKCNGSNGKIAKHGLGVYYLSTKGYIIVRNWRNGEAHGMGERVWLQSSLTWKENSSFMEQSPLRESGPDGLSKSIPFNYKGKFQRGSFYDKHAVVTLKDGTTRVGPWQAGQPVGDWHDHSLVIAPSSRIDFSSTEAERNENTARAVDRSKQVSVPSKIVVGERDNTQSKEFEASSATKRTNPHNSSSSIPVAKRPRQESKSTNQSEVPSTPSEPREGLGVAAIKVVEPKVGVVPPSLLMTSAVKATTTSVKKEEPNMCVSHEQPKIMPQQASKAHDERPASPARIEAKRVAVKVEEADVISICDSEESSKESVPVKCKNNSDALFRPVPIKCEYSGGTYADWTEEEVRPHQISSFLCSDLIGGNPSMKTTDMYAKKLYERGFESVDMIKLFLERDHVRSFEWMTQLHKGIIIRKLDR